MVGDPDLPGGEPSEPTFWDWLRDLFRWLKL